MPNDTLTLTGFLLARIAEDEAAARAGDRVGVYPGMFDDHFGARTGDGERGAYAARFDPTRVLRRCEADRQIVEKAMIDLYDGGYGDGMQTAVAILAAVYADHPDYDEGWRP